MEKIKKFVKKYDNLIMLVIIAIIVLPNIFYKELQPYDNLWNFGNIYKLYEGKMIYSDVNIIQTPIFFWIGEFLYKIFTPNFFIFNMYGFAIMTSLYFLIYRICRRLEIRKLFSSLITIIAVLITLSVISYGTNYNTLAFVFFEIGIISLLKHKEDKYILQGFFTVLIFLTYQKLGVGYFILYFLFKLTSNRSLKKAVIDILKMTMASIGFMLIFLLIECINKNVDNFINFCFLSVSDFAQNTKAENKEGIINIVTALLVVILSIILINKNIIKSAERRNVLILLFSAIGANLVIIPIVNGYHVKIALVLWAVLLVYELYYILLDILTDKKVMKILTVIEILLIAILVIQSIILTCMCINKIVESNKDYKNLLFGAIISKELENNITNVDEYIKENQTEGKNIKVLSSYAMLYTLEMNIDNGYFDEPLLGNFGAKGTNEMLEKINNLSNGTIILVENEEKTAYPIYQFASSLRDYIKEHYQYIESVENYDVYEIVN